MKYDIVWHFEDDDGRYKEKILQTCDTYEEADDNLLGWIRLPDATGWYSIEESFEREPVKTRFTSADLTDPKLFSPCRYCHAEEWWPTCDDGATCSACNHCKFAVLDYITYGV